MPVTAEFREAAEDLEILWIAGLTTDAEGNWLVRPVTRGIGTGNIRMWRLPIGLWPVLAPGRCFTNGELARAAVRGELDTVAIADISTGREVTSADIPSGLYSFDGRPGGVQKLLRYDTASLACLVPTAELVRYLFIHNKTMANTLMHRGGIMKLFAPETPGHHPHLHLAFSERMPVKNLSKPFAEEFAWAAVHPEGRKAWDSVRDQTEGNSFIRLQPPSIKDATLKVRCLRDDGTMLVLEILHMTGRTHPCDRLSYSHPSLTTAKRARTVKPTNSIQGGADESADEDTFFTRDYIVESTSQGSRSSVRQTALHALGKSGSFDRKIPVEKIIAPTARRMDSAQGKRRRRPGAELIRRSMKTSVGEESLTADLPPIEFAILEPADPDYLGELEPLIRVIRTIAAKHPEVSVAASLCSLKQGRAFSMAGRNRRACLVAILKRAGHFPVVLIDVDHSGEHRLSCMALLYHATCDFQVMERHIVALLDGLVDKGGRWDMEIAQKFADVCGCRRFRRVLRRHDRLEDTDYVTGWADKLALRLGLAPSCSPNSDTCP